MYRIKIYKGQFVHDEREGEGMVIYPNGDTMQGHFQKGQPHGTMVFTFAKSKRVSIAKYVRGERKEWVELKIHKQMAKKLVRLSSSQSVK